MSFFSVRVRTKELSEYRIGLDFTEAMSQFRKFIERKDLEGKLGTAAVFDTNGRMIVAHRFDAPEGSDRDFRGKTDQVKQPRVRKKQ